MAVVEETKMIIMVFL